MAFVRCLSDKLIEKLKGEELFNKCLLPDIEQYIVFPAIRKNEIHFYYKGGRLFKYTNLGFMSHIKYAFVCRDEEKDRDIKESDLSGIKPVKPITNFVEGYKRIKEHCEKYNAGNESDFVSRLFAEYSYINPKPKDNIVILDIEAAFKNSDNKQEELEKKSLNKFDIVLYNKNTQALRVVEAKLYSNKELHEKSDNKKNIINQIKTYEGVIQDEKQNILDAYKNYLEIVKKIFPKLDLPTNCTLEDKVGLIYFDFDTPNQNSPKYQDLNDRLSDKLPDNPKYPIGNTTEANNLKKFFQ